MEFVYSIISSIYNIISSNYIITQYVLFGLLGMFSAVLYKLSPVIEIIFWFGLQKFGYNHYEIDDSELVELLNSKICESSTIIKNNDQKIGYVFSWKDRYFAHITQRMIGEHTEFIYVLITTTEKYKELTLKEKVIIEKAKTVNFFYNNSANISWCHWRKQDLTIREMKYHKWQKKIIDTIITKYSERKNCVVAIHGPSGKGKSTLALLVAKYFESSYTNDYKPHINKFSSLYVGKREITPQKPLIVSLDEFDIIIENFGKNKLKKCVPDIFDKQSWNMFFDNVRNGIYPYVIFILTTNKPIKYFNDLDPSYLASHRVDYQINI